MDEEAAAVRSLGQIPLAVDGRPAWWVKREAAMNLDDAIKAFESPRPNGWFRDDEVKAALEALREKREREKAEVKRPTLEEMEAAVNGANGALQDDWSNSNLIAIVEAGKLIRAVREDTVPRLVGIVHVVSIAPSEQSVWASDRLRAIGQQT